VGYHIVANDGDTQGLFWGAFMVWLLSPSNMDREFTSMPELGSPNLLNDITANQQYFDQLVVDAGCQGSADPIACLRTLPFDKLGDAINQSPSLLSYQSLAVVWDLPSMGCLSNATPKSPCSRVYMPGYSSKMIMYKGEEFALPNIGAIFHG
jgi:hypothetical protein